MKNMKEKEKVQSRLDRLKAAEKAANPNKTTDSRESNKSGSKDGTDGRTDTADDSKGVNRKRVKFANIRPSSAISHATSRLKVPVPKANENGDLKKRVKKSQSIEQTEAKHDLLTALRVAMRKMLEEAITLTNQNMQDNRREIQERVNKKKAIFTRKYQATLTK